MASEEKTATGQPPASPGSSTGLWIAIGCVALAAVAVVAVIGIAAAIAALTYLSTAEPPVAEPALKDAPSPVEATEPTEPPFLRAQGPDVGLTAADVATANTLVTSKEARAPFMHLDLGGGRTMRGIDLITLGQDRALPEDVYVMLLVKCRQATGKLPPPPEVDSGAAALLQQFHPDGAPTWKRRAIQRFWGDYCAGTFSPDELARPDHIARSFVRYLEAKSYARGEVINRRLGAVVAGMESWNKAVAGWHTRESESRKRDDAARALREAYLTEWQADWAVQKAAEAIQGGQ